MLALISFVSLAVDMGRVQVAKLELSRAADAAVRYGVRGLVDGTSTAKAIAAAGQNTVDGSAMVLLSTDIQTGTWNSSTDVFTPTATSPTSLRIIARRAQTRGTGIPLLFAKVIGRPYLDLTATTIATYQAAVNVSIVVNSKGDPWLAGMPNGTTANSYDKAPANSPTQVSSGMVLTAGAALNFQFTGSASYKPTDTPDGPDGDLSRMIYNCSTNGISIGREHGMANLTAPIGSVVGVFLSNTQPNLAGALPSDLDFTAAMSRDFDSLSPALRQPFFIGDGQRANTSLQDFIVPVGATRLYIGIMDGQQWSDNSGSFSAATNQPASTSLVK